jgi:myb proto-oncogene protein
LVSTLGTNQWVKIASLFPDRSVRQLRERWKYYLDPQLDKSPFSEEEDRILIEGQIRFGNHWKIISKELLPNRTDIALRNRFYQIRKEMDSKERQLPSISMFLNENDRKIFDLPIF